MVKMSSGSSCLGIQDVLNETTRLLKNGNIESPRLDAELLLAKALSCDKIDLYIDQDLDMDEHSNTILSELVNKRLNHMPIQYILGHTEFMSLDFAVDENVLIPRPETELIVETVLEIVNNETNDITDNIDIIDLCTGSGNIGVSIAVLLRNANVYSCDISNDALTVARVNAKKHKVDDRTIFLQGDIFDAFEAKHIDLKADFIVSNPPYVAEYEWDSLQPEIYRYEPYQALVGGNDGFDFHRRIIAEAKNWLKDGRYLILEIGDKQLNGVIELINSSQNENNCNCPDFEFLNTVKDLQGIDRVVVAKRI
ncbi:MAG: peptide chain release factor N(5)-glutamine methyltransferase [Candidatus Anammoxibacter sp.]